MRLWKQKNKTKRLQTLEVDVCGVYQHLMYLPDQCSSKVEDRSMLMRKRATKFSSIEGPGIEKFDVRKKVDLGCDSIESTYPRGTCHAGGSRIAKPLLTRTTRCQEVPSGSCLPLYRGILIEDPLPAGFDGSEATRHVEIEGRDDSVLCHILMLISTSIPIWHRRILDVSTIPSVRARQRIVGVSTHQVE